MKVRRLFQNIIVKEKIAKIAFLMKDVHCPCMQRKLNAHSKIMYTRDNNNLFFKCIAYFFIFITFSDNVKCVLY